MALPIDPDADQSRRAWKPRCPRCIVTACDQCDAGKNCDRHWNYLINNRGRTVTVQCHRCAHMWSVRT